MSKKKQPVVSDNVARAWTAAELAVLHRSFATSTNAALAAKLKRTIKSVSSKGASLGISKSSEHRSEQSRRTALAAGKTSEEMAALGSLGGKVGGKARAESLTSAKRKKIAKAAIKARWDATKPMD